MSTSVTVLLNPSETVCLPLEYEPLAMPILTPPLETETSLKTGLELGKLAPMRTDSGLPFTEILTAPLCASVRAAVSVGLLFGAVVLEVVVVDVPVTPLSAAICWMNGSLLAKVEKLVSCSFECLGSVSEFGSGVLVAGAVAAVATPVGAVAGVVVAGVAPESVVLAVVVVAGGGADDFFPPR